MHSHAIYIYPKIFHIIIYSMAEGGFDNENPWLDHGLDRDGDDDDDDEEEVDRTRPFQPGTASIPKWRTNRNAHTPSLTKRATRHFF